MQKKIKKGDVIKCDDGEERTVRVVEADGTIRFIGSKVVSKLQLVDSN